MGRSIIKYFIKEIWHSKSRFASIFAIIMVGVSSYAGLRTTGPDMKQTADTYFDSQQFADITIQSPLGLTDEDVEKVGQTEGVAYAAGGWTIDAYLRHGDEDSIIKAHSLSEGVNRPVMVQGRMPLGANECVVGTDSLGLFSLVIGDRITLKTEEGIYEDALAEEEFTIVGTVESPSYISLSKGTSTLGNGIVMDYVYLPESAFQMEYYTDINLLAEGSAALDTFSDKYDSLISVQTLRLEKLGEVRAQVRYNDIIGEANDEIAKAEQELEDAKADANQQLQEAQTKIDDANAEIQAAEAELQEGEQELDTGVADAERELDASYDELTDAEADIKTREAQLNAAKKDLERAKADYSAAQSEFTSRFSAAEQEIAAAQAQVESYRPAISQAEATMKETSELIYSLKQSAVDTSTLEALYETQKAQYNAAVSQLNSAQAQVDAMRSDYNTQKANKQAELNSAKAEIDAANAEISAAQRSINSAKQQVNSGWSDYNQGKNELNTSEAESETELQEGSERLDIAKQDLAAAEAEYEEAKVDADVQIADAEQDLREAKDRVEEINEGSWYVRNRKGNPGYSSFNDDADRITALASVFPIIFFLVAALVSLTTMTRMVESKRTENGTMRAMGYGKLSIAMIYIMYGFFASLGGSIAGFFLGIHLIPTIIFDAYSQLLYTLPELIIPIRVEYLVSSILISIVCVSVATLWACYSSFMETPSSLMKPRTPLPGKRIFLERLGLIWNYMPFKYKVTARNILRYKKRFFMTLIGICGCTGLLIAGFGLRESIMNVVDIQYNELTLNNMSVTINDTATDDNKEGINSYLESSDLVEQTSMFKLASTTASTDKRAVETYYVVPEDLQKFPEFYVIRDNATKAILPLTDDGVVISKKLSELLGVGVGEEVTIDMGEPVPVKVTGICENYVYHYVFMTPNTYQSIADDSLTAGTIYVKYADDSSYDELSTYILEHYTSGVTSVSRLSDGVDLLQRSMRSIDAAVLIIIVAAAVLAFVVLYNLNNINITERMRELCTIKVLGYYNLEVSSYLFRENVILTLLGILLLGQVFGMFLHQYLVHTVEIEMMMFGRTASLMSYLNSIVLTMLFSMIVNGFVHFRLKKIDMVESVKMPD